MSLLARLNVTQGHEYTLNSELHSPLKTYPFFASLRLHFRFSLLLYILPPSALQIKHSSLPEMNLQ